MAGQDACDMSSAAKPDYSRDSSSIKDDEALAEPLVDADVAKGEDEPVEGFNRYVDSWKRFIRKLLSVKRYTLFKVRPSSEAPRDWRQRRRQDQPHPQVRLQRL